MTLSSHEQLFIRSNTQRRLTQNINVKKSKSCITSLIDLNGKKHLIHLMCSSRDRMRLSIWLRWDQQESRGSPIGSIPASLHHSRFSRAVYEAVLKIVQEIMPKRLEKTSYATVPLIPGLLSGSLFYSTITLLRERFLAKNADFLRLK